MNTGGARPRVLLVTDGAFGDDAIVRCVRLAARALPAGWLGVQLRDKRRPLVSLRLFALELRRVTRAVGARLVVNGDARLARDVGADGVHLGGGAGRVGDARACLGPSAWISVAAHSDAAVRDAVTDGADAVLVSPVFASRPPRVAAPPKEARGLEVLRSARALARAGGRPVAVYALGGVDAGNARACIEAGADGVAVVRALLASPDPGRVARTLHESLARAGGAALAYSWADGELRGVSRDHLQAAAASPR
jgi:thiamine-phosphate pyrophosphorylase